MLIGAGDSLAVARAFKELGTLSGISDRYSFEFYTDREIRNKTVKGDHIQDASIIMGDFMHGEVEGLPCGKPARGWERCKTEALQPSQCKSRRKVKKRGFLR